MYISNLEERNDQSENKVNIKNNDWMVFYACFSI